MSSRRPDPLAQVSDFDIRLLRIFRSVVECGGFSAAETVLGIGRSAISQQISALEAALRAKLLDRTQRPVLLTAAGETFRRHAQAIVNELAAARAAIGLSGLSGLSSFRLGFIEDFEAELPANAVRITRDAAKPGLAEFFGRSSDE